MLSKTRLHHLIVMLLVLSVAACAWSPEAKVARHLERGDKYFAQQKYKEAIIEYKNVLQIESKNGHAFQQLGFAHYALGEMGLAMPYLATAKELDPENPGIRIKLATILLLSGKPEEARQETDFILGKDPKNFDALVLSAGLAREPDEVKAVIERFQELESEFGDRGKFHLVLGELRLRNKNLVNAESAFKEALAREPGSIDAHLGLSAIYLSQGDVAQAEKELLAAANLAPFASPVRLKLAAFYLLTKRPDEAKKVLSEVIEKAPEFLPASFALAEMALQEKDYDQCFKILQPVFKKNPSDLGALALRGKVYLAKRETPEAIRDFQEIVKLQPKSPQARYQLAGAYLQSGNINQAKGSLKEAVALNPGYAQAILALAELDLKTGVVQSALDGLEKLTREQPEAAAAAYPLLARAYLANREVAKASEAYRQYIKLRPKDPRGPYLLGLTCRQEGKKSEARQHFEAALTLQPAFLDALAQLVAMDMADKKGDEALQRIKHQIVLVPNSAGFQFLLGRVYQQRRDIEQAEAAFLKGIELDPKNAAGFLAISRFYAEVGKDQQALEKLAQVLKEKPDNEPALLLTGMIYERQGTIPKARETYEKILALNPKSVLAANNLAYLYSEHGGDQQKALELAQLAGKGAPEDPHVADTLGWILYKTGNYDWALTWLQVSASKLPENPEVQYHIGMTHYRLQHTQEAKKALETALQSGGQFAGADEARRVLGEL
jgi:tetratricopeptide (TPR) repeat protein